MLNSDQDILKIIAEALDESVVCGYDEYYNAAEAIKKTTVDEVQQHMELMQLEIFMLQNELRVAKIPQHDNVKMYIDWGTQGDKTCAMLCRKVGEAVEIIDIQYSPY